MQVFPLIFLVFFIFSGNVQAAGGGGGSSPYMSIDPPIVVNIRDGEGSRFLQITSEVRLADPSMSDVVQHHMAMVRHTLIMLFSEQTPQSINSLEGKERLREESLAALQYALEEETGEAVLQNIYFTGFVIQ